MQLYTSFDPSEEAVCSLICCVNLEEKKKKKNSSPSLWLLEYRTLSVNGVTSSKGSKWIQNCKYAAHLSTYNQFEQE